MFVLDGRHGCIGRVCFLALDISAFLEKSACYKTTAKSTKTTISDRQIEEYMASMKPRIAYVRAVPRKRIAGIETLSPSYFPHVLFWAV